MQVVNAFSTVAGTKEVPPKKVDIVAALTPGSLGT